MLNFLSFVGTQIKWGSEFFGFGTGPFGNPAIIIFGFPIYLYALIIVSGMGLAIYIGSRYFKKRGYDPYDVTIYALAVIPLAVLGARAYVYIFPWAGRLADWSTFFQFRSGGLGIYGAVIVGAVTVWVTCKIKKQSYRIVADCFYPGLILAQSIGRWGNFVNQEAYGNLVSTDYNAFSNWFSFLGGANGHGFNGLYVWIGNGTGAGGWYQATFFYESFATFIGFLIMVLVLTPNKHYRLGWNAAFYGIYYGTVRLIVEGLRSDSLFLYIGTTQTDIKISQLVSIFAIILGIWILTRIYRKTLHSWYSKLFSDERQEVANSRYVLACVATLLVAVAVLFFIASRNKHQLYGVGGESWFIAGGILCLLGIYALLGVFSCNDRLKLYSSDGTRKNHETMVSQASFAKTSVIVYCAGILALVIAIVVCLVCLKYDATGKMLNPNNIVLTVLCTLAIAFCAWQAFANYGKIEQAKKRDGTANLVEKSARLSTFWLFVFPFKVYPDYTTDNLHEYVEVVETNGKKA